MDEPAVSVVVPTRNRPALLAATVQAVRQAAAGTSAEVIVVDDASFPPVAQDVPDVRLLRHRHRRGVAAARNTGLAAARAPLVAFCDDDDTWLPGKLAAQIAALGAHTWCIGAALVVDDAGRLVHRQPVPAGSVGDALRHRNPVPGGGSAVLARTDVVRAVGGSDERFAVFADWDLWLRLAATGEPARVTHPVVAIREHPDQMAADAHPALAELALLRAVHGLEPSDATTAAWILRRSARGPLPSRLRALQVLWPDLPGRSRPRALAAALQPPALRRARDHGRGRRLRPLDPREVSP